MAIVITCSGCGISSQAPDELAGRAGKCRRCGLVIKIPGQPAAHPQSTAPVIEKAGLLRCGNCDGEIGRLERPFEWDGHRVCYRCYSHLSVQRASTTTPPSSVKPFVLADQSESPPPLPQSATARQPLFQNRKFREVVARGGAILCGISALGNGVAAIFSKAQDQGLYVSLLILSLFGLSACALELWKLRRQQSATSTDTSAVTATSPASVRQASRITPRNLRRFGIAIISLIVGGFILFTIQKAQNAIQDVQHPPLPRISVVGDSSAASFTDWSTEGTILKGTLNTRRVCKINYKIERHGVRLDSGDLGSGMFYGNGPEQVRIVLPERPTADMEMSIWVMDVDPGWRPGDGSGSK